MGVIRGGSVAGGPPGRPVVPAGHTSAGTTTQRRPVTVRCEYERHGEPAPPLQVPTLPAPSVFPPQGRRHPPQGHRQTAKTSRRTTETDAMRPPFSAADGRFPFSDGRRSVPALCRTAAPQTGLHVARRAGPGLGPGPGLGADPWRHAVARTRPWPRPRCGHGIFRS